MTGPDAATTAANARMHVENGEVFAIVSGLSAGADKELAAVDARRGNTFHGTSHAADANRFSGQSQSSFTCCPARVNKRALLSTSQPESPS